MSGGPVFVDTNVLLYSIDTVNPIKQAAARHWLDVLWRHGSGCLSWQVLNEFYYNATHKLGAPRAVVRASVESYVGWQTAAWDVGLLRRAWQWTDQAGITYWDALILAAAERLQCRWLLTEDFQHSRRYGQVQVINPFRTGPGEIFEA